MTSRKVTLSFLAVVCLCINFLAVPISSYAADGNTTVYATKTGERYHNAGCSSLRKSSYPMTLQQAVNSGLTQCQRCDSPALTESTPEQKQSTPAASVPATASTAATPTNATISADGIVTTKFMTQEQLQAFASATNPAKDTKPETVEHPDAAGLFAWGDFAAFNSYASDNGLAGTPVYLIGTVSNIIPITASTRADVNYAAYALSVVVTDIDGYQWNANVVCASYKYDELVNALNGQVITIFGQYSGYSDTLKMPSMDTFTIFRASDNLSFDFDPMYM